MALRESAQGEQRSAADAVFRDGLAGVAGAGGLEAAGGGEQRRDPPVVERETADGEAGAGAHRRPRRRRAVPNSCVTSWKPRESTPRLAITTRSAPESSQARQFRRKASRTRRLTRLRTTAPPILRLTETPRRGRSRLFTARKRMNPLVWRFDPRSKTARNSDG